MVKIINGKEISNSLIEKFKKNVDNLKSEYNICPALAVIIVGDNPASKVYVNNKKKVCEKIGIKSYEFTLPTNTTESELLKLIYGLNRREDINGILVQLPLPSHINEKKIISKETIFVAPKDAQKTLEENFPNHEKFYVEPNQELNFDNFEVKVIPAYNINKNFHKKEFGWVGYIFKIDNITYTILGDTDEIPEHETLKTNVLFVPIGGTYTMNAEEAALLVNKIKPDLAVPVHYNAIVGSKEDEGIFLENLDKNIKYQIFL